MSELARQFQPRAYRYTLRPQENCFIRFAGPQRTPWEEGTEIRNLSASGLIFTTPDELCPMVGEVIKVEFIVPPETQMACFAKVIRIEQASRETQAVGIKFTQLTPAHSFVLKRGLSTSRKIRRRQDRWERVQDLAIPLRNRWTLLCLWLLSLVLFASCIYGIAYFT